MKIGFTPEIVNSFLSVFSFFSAKERVGNWALRKTISALDYLHQYTLQMHTEMPTLQLEPALVDHLKVKLLFISTTENAAPFISFADPFKGVRFNQKRSESLFELKIVFAKTVILIHILIELQGHKLVFQGFSTAQRSQSLT